MFSNIENPAADEARGVPVLDQLGGTVGRELSLSLRNLQAYRLRLRFALPTHTAHVLAEIAYDAGVPR